MKRKTLAKINKLSTLLAIAIRDLKKQERAKDCRIDMTTWWEPRNKYRDICVTCMAGAVMKYSLQKPRTVTKETVEVIPSMQNYDAGTNLRLHAINNLRQGEVRAAAVSLHWCTQVGDRSVCAYGVDREQFWRDVEQLLADLLKAGE